MHLNISPKKILQLLFGVILSLMLLDAVATGLTMGLEMRGLGLVTLFSVNRECNIPSFYSTLAIAVAGVLLAVTSRLSYRSGRPFVGWIFLSVIFMFLAVDELASIHEKLGDRFGASVNPTDLGYLQWPILYGIGLIIFALAFARFLFSLPRRTVILFVASGSIFVLGAIGFEILGFRYAAEFGFQNFIYWLSYAIEEFLEMSGIALFIYAILDYMVSTFSDLILVVNNGHSGSTLGPQTAPTEEAASSKLNPGTGSIGHSLPSR